MQKLTIVFHYFDKTYKVKNYDYKVMEKFLVPFNFDNLLENSLLIDKVNHYHNEFNI